MISLLRAPIVPGSSNSTVAVPLFHGSTRRSLRRMTRAASGSPRRRKAWGRCSQCWIMPSAGSKRPIERRFFALFKGIMQIVLAFGVRHAGKEAETASAMA